MNLFIKPILLISAFLLSVFASFGQHSGCSDFDRFIVGTNYNENLGNEPGDILGNDGQLSVSIDFFYDVSGVQQFQNMEIKSGDDLDFFYHGVNSVFSYSSISTKFDFTTNINPVYLVEMHSFRKSGSINIGINGSTPTNYLNFGFIPEDIAPGIQFFLTEVPNQQNLNVITFMSTDPIEDITIGGENLLLDNICYSESAEHDCRYYNPMSIPECDSMGNLDLVLYLSRTLDNPQTIQISGNGNDYGFFTLVNDDPILINDLNPNNLPPVIELVITDPDNACLGTSTFFRNPNCGQDTCFVSDIDFTVGNCDTDGQFWAKLDFISLSPIDSFDLALNNLPFGKYSYADLPIALGPFQDSTSLTNNILNWEITLSDSLCNDVFAVTDTVNCGNLCNFTNVEVFDLSCKPTLDSFNFSFYLDTLPGIQSDSFELFYESRSLGKFDYSQIPIQNIVVENQGGSQLSVTAVEINPDVQNGLGCQSTVYFPTPCLACGNNLTIAVDSLPDTNGNYLVTLNLDAPSDATRNFELYFNTQLIDTFSYTQLPIIEDFNCAIFSDSVFVEVKDLGDSTCVLTNYYEIDCTVDSCQIADFNATIDNCTNNNFDLKIDFTTLSGNANTVEVKVDGTVIGQTNNGLDSTFTALTSTNQNLQIEICDVADSTCCKLVNVLNPCFTQCEIEIVDIAATACDNDGQFNIILNVNATNPSGNNFVIFVDNVLQTSATYQAGTQQFTVGPFDGTTNNTFQILVFDVLNPACQATAGLPSPNCNPIPCNISDIQAEATQCNGDNFDLNIFFDFQNVTNQFFDLYVDGNLIGFFPYTGLPLTVNNLPNDADGIVNIKINDNDNPTCADSLRFSNPCTDCSIDNLDIATSNCSPTNEFFFTLTANIDNNNPTDSFAVAVDGQLVRVIQATDLNQLATTGVDVGPFDGSTLATYSIEIRSFTNPLCNISSSIQFECPPAPVCSMSDLVLEPRPCANGQFLLDIDFQIQNAGVSDSFFLFRNGLLYSKFAYSALGITVGPFVGDGSVDNFTVVDDIDSNCQISSGIITPNCPLPQCTLSDLTVSALPCDTNGEFEATINFNYANIASTNFVLFIDGNLFGTFAYTQLPITVGPLTGDGSNFDFEVRDADNFNCKTDATITSPNCPPPPCMISGLNVDPSACDANGNFSATINFTVANSPSANFSLFVNGNLAGIFAYASLPVSINGLVGDGSNYSFLVRDNDSLACAEDLDITAPNCQINNCELLNFTANALPCDLDGNFLTEIDFDVQNPASANFVLQLNGNNIGTFNYSELPITIGPNNADGSQLNFLATDPSDSNCQIGGTLVAPICSPVPCELSNLLIETHDCDANNQFLIDLEVDQNAAASDSFNLFVNNTFYQTYTYSNPFITAGPFDGDGNPLNFEVQDSGDSNCLIAQTITAPDCTPPCNIYDVTTSTTDCNLDEFYYELDFLYENTSDSFTVNLVGGSYSATFAYTNLPVNIGPFTGNGAAIYSFEINDQNIASCELGFSAISANCDCEISGISTQTSTCDSNQEFTFGLNFAYANVSDSFRIDGVGNGFSETHAYANLPVQIGPFPGNGQMSGYLITDLQRTNCIEDFSIAAPDCTPPCDLTNPILTVNDCDNQGNYDVTINFDHNNSSDFFNTNGYGIYAYADLPVTIGPFAGDGMSAYSINITDLNDNDCSLPLHVPARFCGDTCQIYNVQAIASPCDSAGNFNLNLQFDFDNANTTGFTVFVNGSSYGPFDYNIPQPIDLGTFAGDGQTLYNIFVFDRTDAACSGSTTLSPVNCLPCELTNLTTRVTNCDSDGNFSVWIDFDAQNGSADGFSIGGNGNDYGSFSYAELPIQLGPFTGDATSVYEFIIRDNQDINCTIETTVGPVDCDTDNCRIFDVQALPTDCDVDGFFFVDVRFNYEDVGNNGFTIRGNGQIYGNFDYSQIPVRLGPFFGDGNTVYEFVVLDNDDNDCNNFTTVGPIQCDDMDCSITDLSVDILDCNGNGTYQVRIDFTANNPTNSRFDLHTTRGLLGTFSLSQLPLVIGNFPSNGNLNDAIRVCISNNPQCCGSVFFSTPQCDGDCIEFESLAAGTVFKNSINPTIVPDTILIENNVSMTTNSFINRSGVALFDSISADSASVFFDAADGIQISTHNATIDFIFPPFPNFPCREITFNYYQDGDLNNLSINGEPIQLFQRFEDLPYDIATAVVAEVFPINAREGSIKLKGFIRTVRLGGEELALDNICYDECLNFLSVWPGDINLDNLVSNLDILNLGVAYGEVGPIRPDMTTDWEALQSEDWLRFFGRGQNYKHSDCNGDGLIDENDLGVMDENYGLFHDNIIDFPQELPPPNSPRIFIEYPDPSTITPGTPFTGRIILGEEANPVFNLYGIAFSMRYDKEKLRILNIQYPPGWYGEAGDDVLTIDKTFDDVGVAHIGLTRINQENVSGHGAMVEFIGIIDDIVGRVSGIDIEIDDVVAISKEEFNVPIEGSINEWDLTSSTIDLPKGSLTVFPNPTTDKIFFDVKGGYEIEEIEILGTNGTVLQSLIPKAKSLTLDQFAPGMYVVKFVIDGQPYYNRIIKQ